MAFEEESQKTTITILNEKSKEETGVSLQVNVCASYSKSNLLIEIQLAGFIWAEVRSRWTSETVFESSPN